jgi:hypothetical protein
VQEVYRATPVVEKKSDAQHLRAPQTVDVKGVRQYWRSLYGKAPSQPHTYNFQGYSILPTEGVFCKVLKGGKVLIGDSIRVLTDREMKENTLEGGP